jgi:hypothetical protein
MSGDENTTYIYIVLGLGFFMILAAFLGGVVVGRDFVHKRRDEDEGGGCNETVVIVPPQAVARARSATRPDLFKQPPPRIATAPRRFGRRLVFLS